MIRRRGPKCWRSECRHPSSRAVRRRDRPRRRGAPSATISADFVVGLQHDAAALADAMDGDLVDGRALQHGFHRPRTFRRRNLDPEMAAIGESFCRGRQIVGIARRQADAGKIVAGFGHVSSSAPDRFRSSSWRPDYTSRPGPLPGAGVAAAFAATRVSVLPVRESRDPPARPASASRRRPARDFWQRSREESRGAAASRGAALPGSWLVVRKLTTRAEYTTRDICSSTSLPQARKIVK